MAAAGEAVVALARAVATPLPPALVVEDCVGCRHTFPKAPSRTTQRHKAMQAATTPQVVLEAPLVAAVAPVQLRH